MTDDEHEILTPLQQVTRDELSRAVREITRSPAGKRLLFWLLEQCGPYHEPFAGEHTNATHYQLGRQSMGRTIIGKLEEVDPRIYPQLLLDMAELREIDKAAAEAIAKKLGDDDETL